MRQRGMTQKVKVLAATPDGLSFIPGSHMVKEQDCKLSPEFNRYSKVHMRTCK